MTISLSARRTVFPDAWGQKTRRKSGRQNVVVLAIEPNTLTQT